MNNNTISITIFVDTDKLNTIDDIEKEIEAKTRQAAKELATQIFYKKEQKIFKEEKLVKKQKVQRYLYTVFGLLKFNVGNVGNLDFKINLCYRLNKLFN